MFAKTVRCNVKTIPQLLIFGKEYEVIYETAEGYTVLDEMGNNQSYKKYMFDVVEFEEEEL
jgi:hypothetical protein